MKPFASFDQPLEPLRRLLLANVHSLTGDSRVHVDFSQPVGDPGWFGPRSVVWRVHADFLGMLTGGVRALLLQALHPLALAGVWDHSSFRTDLQGRLARTALFVACTTYGPTRVAEAAVERVRRIHGQVTGRAPDGRPYAANDPSLLTWVHVAEVSSFLHAYRRLVEPGLLQGDIDRYYDETARVAEALGAAEVPRSAAAVERYLHDMQPELQRSERSDEVVRVLRALSGVGRLGLANQMVVQAGFDQLPAWAAERLGVTPAPDWQQAARRAALKRAVPLMRWVLRDGVAAQSRRRCAALA